MFKNTNQFFSKVFEGKVTFIEQQNYIESITGNYDLKKLRTLSFDLTIFISNKREELEDKIENENIENEIKRYKELGLKIPYRDALNLEYFSAEIANLPLENIPKTIQVVDLIEMFHSSKSFNINNLKNRIKESINKQLESRKQELEKELKPLTKNNEPENKHPTMFVNGGYKLFEYILNNHIAVNRGRINDISFYYWKMYNDKLIIQKPYPFVEWFMDLYAVENFQIKTLKTVQNTNRLKHYSNSLDWFKLQNQ
jgi:hypothetical protein